MTDANKTEVVVVVDRSGSMQSIREDAEGGLNSFLDKMKMTPGDIRLTLAQFNSEYRMLYENQTIREVPKYVLVPRSSTALYDAIGMTMWRVGERLSHTPEHDRPGKVVFMIVTDGEENDSHEYTRDQVKKMITEQKNKYGWQFSYFCTSENALYDGMRLGMDQSSVFRFTPSGMGVRGAYGCAGQSVCNYVSGVTRSVDHGTGMVDAQGNIVQDPLKHINLNPQQGGSHGNGGTGKQ